MNFIKDLFNWLIGSIMHFIKLVKRFISWIIRSIKKLKIKLHLKYNASVDNKGIMDCKNNDGMPSGINLEKILDFLSMPLRNTKIQTRLFVSFTGLVSLLLVFTSILSYRKSSEAIKTKISTYSIQITNQLGDYLDKEMDKYGRFINDFSSNSTLFQDVLAEMTSPATDVFYRKSLLMIYQVIYLKILERWGIM